MLLAIWPKESLIALVWIFGVFAVVFGVMQLVLAYRVRRMMSLKEEDNGWVAQARSCKDTATVEVPTISSEGAHKKGVELWL